MRVTHVITGLDVGGAEMMLLKLIQATPDITHTVISLRRRGPVAPMIEACGVTVQDCGFGGLVQSLAGLPRLARLLKQSRPDIVQGWMYHGNLAASLAMMLSRLKRPLAWSIRTILRKFSELGGTRLLVEAGIPFSRGAGAILYNSELAMTQHESLGYVRRGHVVNNGFDVERFRPDAMARGAMRARLGIAPDALVIGFVGRLVPVKDFPTFLAAAARLAANRQNVVVVAVGRDIQESRATLPQSAADIDALAERLHLLPESPDVPALLQGFDILALTSLAEGFPNVVGEAMASGLACVATDVGACRSLIGDTGLIVPPADPQALATALTTLADMPQPARSALGERARARIVANFSLAASADVYRAVWTRLTATQK